MFTPIWHAMSRSRREGKTEMLPWKKRVDEEGGRTQTTFSSI